MSSIAIFYALKHTNTRRNTLPK